MIFKKWKIHINRAKFQNKARRAWLSPFNLLQLTLIPPTNNARNLGLFIDKRLNWNPHIRLNRIELTNFVEYWNDYLITDLVSY